MNGDAFRSCTASNAALDWASVELLSIMGSLGLGFGAFCEWIGFRCQLADLATLSLCALS